MQLIDRIVDQAFERARQSGGSAAPSEWVLRQPPTEYVRHAGPVTMVCYATSTAPAVIDRDIKLDVFVAVEGGGRLRVLSAWAPTIVAAKALGDRLLAGDGGDTGGEN